MFTFWNSIFVKYDLLNEYLTLFWFAMLINECKPEFQFKKSSKNAKFGQCLYLVAHLCYEQNRFAERTVTPLYPPLLWAEPIRRTDCNPSLKRGYSPFCASVLLITKVGHQISTLSKFRIFRTLFELKLWFTFIYKHSKPKKCQIFI